MDRPLTIVIPVYNEGANFPALWAEMTEHLDFPFTALVAYDFDGDDTLPVAQQIIAQGESSIEADQEHLRPWRRGRDPNRVRCGAPRSCAGSHGRPVG